MKLKLANWTIEGAHDMRESLAEFLHDLRSPWTLIPGVIAALIVAVLIVLPWLTK